MLVVQAVHGQSQATPKPATVQGHVRDRSKQPVVGANVYVHSGSGTKTLTVRTDSEGDYYFSGLRGGTYRLDAEKTGLGVASFGPFVLAEKEIKTIDLTLEPRKAPNSQGSSLGTPEFFDEPKFTVAGVTDSTNLGGHGSNATLGTTESLTKKVVSLGREPPSGSPPLYPGATEQALRLDVEREPGSFAANHQLGKLLVENGKPSEALPYLEQASRLKPGDYHNAYQLALAYAGAGEYERARLTVQSLLAGHDKAEVHHLLGEVYEKLGNPLDAVHEYQRAAELDPSEPNLFDWAAELLIHRATEPSIAVFTKGNRLFPQSVRMLAGLGVARYAEGDHAQGVRHLCQASDMNPNEPSPYLLLGRMVSTETAPSEEAAKRLERFTKLQPDSALANYYFALSLWKIRKSPSEGLPQVEALLEKAVHLDPKLAPAYLQLGVLYSEKEDLPKAILAYQKAIAADPRLEEAHYRLGQAYAQMGESLKAQKEIQFYKQLSKETADQVERERRQTRQFIYTLERQNLSPAPQ